MAVGPLALLVAFALSPVAVEVARHLMSEPWKLPVLAVPFLLWRLVHLEATGALELRSGDRSGGRRTGLVCIGLAVALELLSLGGGLPRWGRPALALAVFGWLRASARASTSTASLAIFLVPVPSMLSGATSPILENGWRALASAILPGMQPDTFPLELDHGDGGWAAAWLGAALGACVARRLAWSPPATVAAIAAGVLAGFACQAIAVVLGVLAVGAGLASGPSVLVVLPGLLLLVVAWFLARRLRAERQGTAQS